MKQEDFLAEDIKAEYKQLIREKERVQARCEKLGFDVEHRRKRILDVGLIGRALQDFARQIDLLPLTDQTELFQLLVHQVEVWPHDPAAKAPPAERDTLTTRIRTQWYRARIALYQLPDLRNLEADLPTAAGVNRAGTSSGIVVFGSARRGNHELS